MPSVVLAVLLALVRTAAATRTTALPAGALLAVRTQTNLTSVTLPVFIDVLDAVSGAVLSSIALPTAAAGAQLRLTLRQSTVEGALTSSTDGCTAVLAGYDAPPGVKAPQLDTTIARSVLLLGGNGAIDTRTGHLGVAALSGIPRSAALLPGPSAMVIVAGDAGVMLPVAAGAVAPASATATLLASNVRSLAPWPPAALYYTSASQVARMSPGAWLANPNGEPLNVTLPGPGRQLGGATAAQGAYGFAVVDSDTVVAADETLGLLVYRFDGAAWTTTQGPSDPEGQGPWTGFSHATADSTGAVFVSTTWRSAADRTTRVYRVAHDAQWSPASLQLSLLARSPADFEYRGLAPAPKAC